MMFYGQDDLGPVRRQVWGRLFGQCVGKTREAAGRSVEEAPSWPGWQRRSGWPSRPVTFPIRHSCTRWLMPWRSVTARSRCWPYSAGRPGSSKPSLPPPRTFRGTGGGTHIRISSLPEEGGESDQDQKEGTGIKRVNINITTELHRASRPQPRRRASI